MHSRASTKNTFLAVVVWIGIASSAWYVWHANRQSAIASLKQQVPPEFSLQKTLAYCSEGGLHAIDVRAVFVGSLSSPSSLAGSRASNYGSWLQGPIPASDFYNESTTFICPSLPSGIHAKLLEARSDHRNWRRYGEYSIFYLPAASIVVVHRYND